MENNNNKLLQALRNSGVDKIFEAYNWVQEHRNQFKKEVYGPVLLEVFAINLFICVSFYFYFKVENSQFLLGGYVTR